MMCMRRLGTPSTSSGVDIDFVDNTVAQYGHIRGTTAQAGFQPQPTALELKPWPSVWNRCQMEL